MLGTEQWDSKAIDTVSELTYAVHAFVSENNQGTNIKVVSLVGADKKPPEKKGDIKTDTYGNENYKAGDHKFYAVVYKDTDGKFKVRFCCEQKGSGNNQFPFADYTYGDVLSDN